MIDVSYQEIIRQIWSAKVNYHKLLVLAAPSRSGKTRLINRIADELKWPVINLSLELSRRLLSLTIRQRVLKAEEVARDILDQYEQNEFCLDNIELLFDSSLRLNPLGFLQDLSRNRLLVTSWNGILEDGSLSFGYPGHPDFFRQSVSGFPVVCLSEEKYHLHLTS